jgi:hypothetical protein
MTNAIHGQQTSDEGIHSIIAFVYPNAGARTGASGFEAYDVGKVALQSDDGSYWLLVTTAPTWAQITTGSAAAPARSTLLFGNNSVTSTTTTRYLSPSYDDTTAPNSPIQFRVPFSGTLRNLRVRHNTTSGNGNPIVYTLRVNGSGTAIAVSLSSTSADGADTSNSVAVSAGDLIDMEVTKASGIGSTPRDITASLEMEAS